LPALEATVQAADGTLAEHQQSIATAEQAMRVAETRRESAIRGVSDLGRAQVAPCARARGHRGTRHRFHPRARRAARAGECGPRGKQESLVTLQKTVESLQLRQRETADAWQRDSKALAT
jgi:hypothetical protein